MKFLLTASLCLSLCLSGAALSSQTREEAVMETMNQYVTSFQARDLDGVMASWGVPAEIVYGAVHATFNTREGLAAFYDEALQGLAPDYGHSELHGVSVKILSDQIALVGWEFTRHRTSGEAYSRAAAMYKVKHGEDGWKMISMLTYDAEAYIPF